MGATSPTGEYAWGMEVLGWKTWLGAMTTLTATIACGPQVATGGTETTSGGSSTLGAETSAAATNTTSGVTSLPPMTGDEVTTEPPLPATTSTTGDDGSSEGESSTGEDFCSCAGTAIPFDAMTDEGFSAADMLAEAEGLEIPLQWYAIADNPSTLVSISVSLADGTILDEPGGCCGSFLCGPCPIGITIPVSFTVESDDGILADVFYGTITGVPGQLSIRSGPLSIGDGAGGWTSQVFEVKGTPLELTSISISASRAARLDRQWVFITGASDDGVQELGGTEL